MLIGGTRTSIMQAMQIVYPVILMMHQQIITQVSVLVVMIQLMDGQAHTLIIVD